MRMRPFISAGESPRPYSDIRAERGDVDPRERALREIGEAEILAIAADDPAERKRLQCDAEALREQLYHFGRTRHVE